MADEIVAAIDALIDGQLAEGETWREQPDCCPHCDRDWHGFPLTRRVADMHRRGSFDEDYRVYQDDSPVLCPGSDIEGPVSVEAVSEYDNLRQLAHFMGMSIDENVTLYTLTINFDSEGNE